MISSAPGPVYTLTRVEVSFGGVPLVSGADWTDGAPSAEEILRDLLRAQTAVWSSSGPILVYGLTDEQIARMRSTSPTRFARVDRFSLVWSRRLFAVDGRPRAPRLQAREHVARAACTRTRQRLIGARQSYARRRCDRRRANLRASRNS